MVHTVLFKNPSFKKACEILAGDYSTKEGIQVCTIRRGLVAYTYIQRDDGKIEVIERSRNITRYIYSLPNPKNTICYISEDQDKPIRSECIFSNGDKAIDVSVSPESHAMYVATYPFAGMVGRKVLLSTVGKHTRHELKISEEYAPYFYEKYYSKVTNVLK